MRKPPLSSLDSLEDKLQLYTNVWGRPVMVDQIIGFATANISEQEERKQIFIPSKGISLGQRNGQTPAQRRLLRVEGGVCTRA